MTRDLACSSRISIGGIPSAELIGVPDPFDASWAGLIQSSQEEVSWYSMDNVAVQLCESPEEVSCQRDVTGHGDRGSKDVANVEGVSAWYDATPHTSYLR